VKCLGLRIPACNLVLGRGGEAALETTPETGDLGVGRSGSEFVPDSNDPCSWSCSGGATACGDTEDSDSVSSCCRDWGAGGGAGASPRGKHELDGT